ncbi:MAG: hypothetical protein H7Y11_03515 [Armatimonadetes bacterium]|nr:hypothetical protein [Anaerolineae bacterium]
MHMPLQEMGVVQRVWRLFFAGYDTSKLSISVSLFFISYIVLFYALAFIPGGRWITPWNTAEDPAELIPPADSIEYRMQATFTSSDLHVLIFGIGLACLAVGILRAHSEAQAYHFIRRLIIANGVFYIVAAVTGVIMQQLRTQPTLSWVDYRYTETLVLPASILLIGWLGYQVATTVWEVIRK